MRAASSRPARTRRERRARSQIEAAHVTRASGIEPRTSTACVGVDHVVAPPARARSTSQMPFGDLALERAGRLDREPTLPNARRPGERHEAVLAQQTGNVGQLVLTADE